jgi:predicted O-linked N-acetylglucosamine transferase (SPINDLY family)
MRRFEEAAAGYRDVLAKDPGYEYARGGLLFSLQSCCDWTSRDDDLRTLQTDLKAGRVVVAPFTSLALLDDPADMQAVARSFVAKQHPPQEPLRRSVRSSHDRIRVAYLSANFNDHAVARLIGGVFECHDKRRFETAGIGFGAAKGEMHARIARAFDRFLDVRDKNDRDVAQLIAEMEVDIAVDLMGFTEHCRPGVFAFRPAPIQVNYLGFPGTMGADYIDYIIADRFVLRDDHQRHFTEQVVYLPDCYLPNDAGRPVGMAPTRGQAGLPDTGFVFCSFNQSYKFTPDLFDIWMRLLRAVDGSVLWLPVCAPAAMRNLKREAEARGVAAQRLVFAPFTATVEDHLARLRLADLFLDTLPYNSHTSTCDALFAGVPLVTCPGATFAGRVAASALNAHGAPELIAESLAGYEELALSIARDPQKAAALKAKIARHRDTHALFDTARFTRHLERAYTGMWRRHQQGEPPRGFSVEPEVIGESA